MNRSDRIPIPTELAKEDNPIGDVHLQEERRLFYVGMTRAEERVYLTAADFYGEAKRRKKISPFVYETIPEDVTQLPEIGNGSILSNGIAVGKIENSSPANHNPIHVDYLSYTQIQTFKICPLHYKLRYILRIPTPKTSALSFGTSVHDTLEDYYQELIGNGKMTKKQLLKRLKANWINEGYKTKTQERRSFALGEEYLSNYYNLHNKLPVTSYATEQKLSAGVVMDGQRIKISGKIDRVDLIPGGLEVTDYKTGEKIPLQRDVDRDEQLTFYALLISKVRQKPYDVDLSNVKLNLYYLKEQRKLTTTRTMAQINAFEQEIFRVKAEIEKSKFECSGNLLCNSCEYEMFCIAP